MSKYRTWEDPSGLTESVKLGWSWPAFLFGGLWAIAKRMTLVGICMLLGSIAIGCVIVATQVEDEDFLLSAASLLLGLFFGANGNSWRERNLRRRGFAPGDIEEKPFLISTRTLLAHPIVGLRALWRDKVVSAVIAGVIVAAIVAGVASVLRPPSPDDRLDSAKSYHTTVVGCKSAKIFGDVTPNGEETFAWFEWGETPNLGNVTVKQRFTDNTEYYQDFVDLKENTTYFYRAMAANTGSTAEGRVMSFTTARCER
jgi:hypothetical protein